MLAPSARAALLLAAVLAPSAPLPAQQQERAVFVARVGGDTVAVEVMTRDALDADATIRFGTPPVRIQQRARLTAAGLVDRISVVNVQQGARGDSIAMRAELTFVGDSIRTHAEGADGRPVAPDRTIAVPAGAIPFLNLSGLSLELVLRRARALGGDSVRVPLLVTGAQRPFVATVAWLGADSAVVGIATIAMRVATDAAGRFLGGSVAAQQLVIERLDGGSRAASWSSASATPSHAAPAGAPYAAEDVVVPVTGGALAGTLTLPTRAAGAGRPATRVPAVLLLSGSGPQDRDGAPASLAEWRPFREIADTLSRRGIAVLRLDDRGVGGSAPSEAGMTMLDEAADARAALAWLRARPEIDAARVGIVGHSSGAAVAALVAADDGRLRALALLAAPATSGRTISTYQIRGIFAQDTTLPPAQRDSMLGVALRQADSAFRTSGWLRHFGSYDPLAAARRVRVPTLLLHGDTDRQVPVGDAAMLARAMQAAGNRRVTVRTLPRTNHLLVDDPSGNVLEYGTLPSLRVRTQLRAVLADWLARVMSPRGAPARA